MIGGVGLIDDVHKLCTPSLKAAGHALVVLGQPADLRDGWLGASLYLREIAGREEGAPQPLDLAGERRSGELVRSLIGDAAVSACHDVGDGGLLVAVAEMALAARGLGARVDVPTGALAHAWCFGEDQGRYVVATNDADRVLSAAAAAGVSASVIGTTTGDGDLTVGGSDLISVETLRQRHEAWLPGYMAGGV